MANVFDISFVLNSALAHSFTGTFSTANKAMGDLQKRMSALSQNQSQIAAFGNLRNASQQTGAQFYAAQQKVDALAAQMRGAGTPSEALAKQFAEAQAKASKLHEKLKGQRGELRQLGVTLKEAGVNTRGFCNEQARLAENTRLAADAAKLQAAQTRMVETQGDVNEARQGLANMRGQILASAGIVMALKAPLQQAATFEQAMARVQAVTMNNTGTKAGAENMRLLSEQSRQLGRDTQFTATQAANSQEMLARAGFNTTEIIDTMPGLLNMAAAEGMDLANAADISASVLRGFNLEASQSMRVADVLAKASSTTNTSIATLGESMKVVAPVASGLGISLEQTAAMIGVMGNAGIKGSLAGNALKAALLRLSKEPPQAKKALEEMGIALKDDAGRLRTMPSLMQAMHAKMKDMGEGDQMNILTRVFGAEAASAMLAVMNAATGNKDLLKELEVAYANAAGTSSEMADIMNDTAQGAMARLSSATESLSTDIGKVLLPPFTWATDALATLIGQISGLAQKYPLVTKVVVGGASAFGAATAAVTSMRLAVLAVKMPFLMMQAAQARAAAAALAAGRASMWAALRTKAHAAAQWAWNAAMNANPIGLAVAAVAALAAGLYFAYQKCEWFRNVVDVLWETLKNLWGWLTANLNWDSFIQGLQNLGEGIRNFFAAPLEGVMEIIGGLSGMADTIIAAITGPFQMAYETVKGWFGSLFGWIFGESQSTAASIAANGAPSAAASASIAAMPDGYVFQNAVGGIYDRPILSWVAEAGVEAIIPLENRSRGIPLWAAAGEAMGVSFGGNSTTHNNTVSSSPVINITVNGGDPGIARRVAEEVRRVLRETREYEDRVSFA